MGRHLIQYDTACANLGPFAHAYVAEYLGAGLAELVLEVIVEDVGIAPRQLEWVLQVVRDGSTAAVAVDVVGCKPGDWVICVGSSAAREAAGSKEYPSDLTIVGIIDHWEAQG